MGTTDFLDAPKLCASKPCIALQAERIKPELGKLVVALNMDMGRFIAIPCIKEEAIWTDSQCSWHLLEFHSIFSRLTPQLTASRQDAPFQFLPNRNVAAIRWSVKLDATA